MNTRPYGKILSLILAVSLLLTQIGVTAFAEEGGDSGVITAFDALPEGMASQTVPLGTSMSALTLPDTLDATVDGAPDSVPVDEWQSEPEYDGDMAGTYIFTAAIPGEYTVADDVEPPIITVTVGMGALAVTITIAEDENDSTALYLTRGVPVSDADLLAGVSAEDETGDPVPVTITELDGLDLLIPQMRSEGYLNPPYIISYAAAHPEDAGVTATTTREVYVTLGAADIIPLVGMALFNSDATTHTVVKKGQYNKTTKQIDWEIIYTIGEITVPATGFTFMDTFDGSKQRYVAGSFKGILNPSTDNANLGIVDGTNSGECDAATNSGAIKYEYNNSTSHLKEGDIIKFTYNTVLEADAYVDREVNNKVEILNTADPGVVFAESDAEPVILPAPTLSAVSVSGASQTGATLNFTSDEAGTYYYLVYAATDGAPNTATVKAQGTAVAKGMDSAVASTNSASITGLSASTAYKAYVVVEDAESYLSTVSEASFSTTAMPDTTAPTLSAVSVSGASQTGATLNFTSDEAGTYYYLVYAATDGAPNAATVKAQGTAVAKGMDSAAASTNTASITGLSASTAYKAYKAYVVVEDAAGNLSTVSEASFSTTATLTPSATIGTVTITGTTGTVLSAQTATITLANDTVIAGGVSVNAATWFSNLPAGVTATANGTAGSTSITITFGGTPSATSTAAFNITIPASALTGGAQLGVTTNPDAKFNITAPPEPDNHDPIVQPSGPVSPYNDALFTFGGNFADLAEIRLNGKLLTQTDRGDYADLNGYPGYTAVLGRAESGSVKVTLYKEFLRILPNGVYSLTVGFNDDGEGTLDFEIEWPSVNNTSSDDSGSGSSVQDTARTTVSSILVVDNAKSKAALAEMEKSGANKARIRHNGEIKVLAEAWPVFGNVPVDFDTVDDDAVQVRVTVREPGKMTVDKLLSGYVKGSIVDSRKAFFEKWFKNKVRVVHLDQQGDFGQPVEIAAKVDLTGMDTANLYFYSYDKANNAYRRIEKPSYWIDKNGYLHFTAEYAGEIIISNGPLERK